MLDRRLWRGLTNFLLLDGFIIQHHYRVPSSNCTVVYSDMDQSKWATLCCIFRYFCFVNSKWHDLLCFIQVKDELYSQRKTAVKITGDSMCSLCHKKIGTSVFAVYPNGSTLVHFVCFRDSQNMKVVGKGSQLKKRLWNCCLYQLVLRLCCLSVCFLHMEPADWWIMMITIICPSKYPFFAVNVCEKWDLIF